VMRPKMDELCDLPSTVSLAVCEAVSALFSAVTLNDFLLVFYSGLRLGTDI